MLAIAGWARIISEALALSDSTTIAPVDENLSVVTASGVAARRRRLSLRRKGSGHPRRTFSPSRPLSIMRNHVNGWLSHLRLLHFTGPGTPTAEAPSG